jgi:hypothetical protein
VISFEPAPLSEQGARARPGFVRLALLGVGAILILALGGAGAWVLTHQQRVSDQFVVWQYEPTATIASYAYRSTMTAEGRFLFYASRPSIESTASFDTHCASELEDVGILGCYVHGERKIFLFNVTDDRLDGLEEVVAAHEMLHAAWDRMPEGDRATITSLLEAEATARADNPAFIDTMEYYATAEPGERLNELHSIVGTEFADISSELEAYYATYFSDREALVELHVASDAVFTERQSAIDGIVDQITALKSSIDADYASYNSGYDSLNSDISSFNANADAGGYFTQAEFDAQRDALVARQADLDALYSSIADRVTEYDGLIAQLDDLNAEVAELNESINIRPRTEGDS